MSFRSDSNISLSIKNTKATPESFGFCLLCNRSAEVQGNNEVPAHFDHAISRSTLLEGQGFNMVVPGALSSLNHPLLQILSLAVLTFNRNLNMHLTLSINHCFRLSLLCCKLLHASRRWQCNSHKDLNTYQQGSFGYLLFSLQLQKWCPGHWRRDSSLRNFHLLGA